MRILCTVLTFTFVAGLPEFQGVRRSKIDGFEHKLLKLNDLPKKVSCADERGLILKTLYNYVLSDLKKTSRRNSISLRNDERPTGRSSDFQTPFSFDRSSMQNFEGASECRYHGIGPQIYQKDAEFRTINPADSRAPQSRTSDYLPFQRVYEKPGTKTPSRFDEIKYVGGDVTNEKVKDDDASSWASVLSELVEKFPQQES